MNRPVLGNQPPVKNPVIPDHLKEPLNWAFSFKYFNQIQYFGLDRAKPAWFVSLIERLKDLCRKDKESFFRDTMEKGRYRYHIIDWGARNIPIQRQDLDWIDKAYLENEEEYPFFQFQLSTGTGRVVGFWNETNTIFYIVLLDPLHNIQPSNYNDYNINDCYPLSCEYTSLLKDIDDLKRKVRCQSTGCVIPGELNRIPTKINQTNAIMAFLDEDFHQEFQRIVEERGLSAIIEYGIDAILSEEQRRT